MTFAIKSWYNKKEMGLYSVYISIFTRYEERCIINHSNKNALAIIEELVELVPVGWDLSMMFKCAENEFKIYDDWFSTVDDLIDDIKLELASTNSGLSKAEIVTAEKLIEHYRGIENTSPSLDSIIKNKN